MAMISSTVTGVAPGARSSSDIVDGLHEDQVLDSWLCEYVALEAGQHADAGSVAQHAVPGDPLVDHGQIRDARVIQALGEHARPRGVCIVRGSGSVGNRIAESYDQPRIRGRQHVNTR